MSNLLRALIAEAAPASEPSSASAEIGRVRVSQVVV